MNETYTIPPDPSDRNKTTTQLVTICQFLAFRPDKNPEVEEKTGEVEYEKRDYRVDGQLMRVIADYPYSDYHDLVWVEFTGQPEQDNAGQLFVSKIRYKVSTNHEITQQTEIIHDIDNDLELNTLPEYHQAIKDQSHAETKGEGRPSAKFFLEKPEPMSPEDRLAFFEEWAVPERVAEFMAKVYSGRISKELGTDVVGDGELKALLNLLEQVKHNPDVYEIVEE